MNILEGRKVIPSRMLRLALALILLGPVTQGDAPAHQAPQKLRPAEDLFRDSYIPTLQIEIAEAGTTSLRENPRKYVRATVREGAVAFTNVAIHLKGGPGSFRPVDENPALTLNFDRFANGQRFHGLKKIHLNNSVQDRTYLSEKISRELFEAAGVPAPRAGNAAVEFNGRDLGLYVLVEGIGKQFLRRYFKDPNGNVYDGHSQSDVTRILPTNSGESPRDQSRLRALAAAAQKSDLNARLASLEKTVDLDRFISFLAMEVALQHWDGYAMNRNNFRIYHNRDSDRLVFLPQGLDQILRQPDAPIFPQMTGLVARSVLEIPECRRRYQERMSQLLTNVFKAEIITRRLAEVAAKVEDVMARTDPQAVAAHKQLVARFCRRFERRANSIGRQLSAPSETLQFDSSGIAHVTDWRPKIDLGNPSLAREQEEGGKTLLRISARESCAASWRSNVLLETGQYRLIGRVRTRGVVLGAEDLRSGAGLRISHRKFGRDISGDTERTLVTVEFEVQPGKPDVELVCELRAAQGDIWFDLKSLRLIRK